MTYIHFYALSIKLENFGVEIKLSIQAKFDVFCFPKAMLFTYGEKDSYLFIGLHNQL